MYKSCDHLFVSLIVALLFVAGVRRQYANSGSRPLDARLLT